ncbi:MAG TPA: hypothetical protein VLX32_02555 [Candidatus Acidoferrum sp.]|nr:hypothetical protein [Candidatus Acidoferrum sp.]
MRSRKMMTALGIITWLGVAVTSAPSAWKHQLNPRLCAASIAESVICPEARAQLVQKIAGQPMVQRIVTKSVETAMRALAESRCGN